MKKSSLVLFVILSLSLAACGKGGKADTAYAADGKTCSDSMIQDIISVKTESQAKKFKNDYAGVKCTYMGQTIDIDSL